MAPEGSATVKFSVAILQAPLIHRGNVLPSRLSIQMVFERMVQSILQVPCKQHNGLLVVFPFDKRLASRWQYNIKECGLAVTY